MKKFLIILTLLCAFALLFFACKKNDDTPAHVHEWGEGEVTKEPTCTEMGLKTYVCAGCGEVKPEDIAPIPHDYRDAVTEPTCVSVGYTTHVCANCGDTYQSDETPIDPNRHQWDEGVVTKEPNDEVAGEITYTCRLCKTTSVEGLPATGEHAYSSIVHAATCTEQGYTEHTCTNEGCDSSYINNVTPALGHDWDDGVVTKEAEAAVEGIMTYTCKRCGDTRTEAIPATGVTPHGKDDTGSSSEVDFPDDSDFH